MTKRSVLAPVAVALVALVTGGWLLQRGVGQERNVYFQAQLFQEVLHHVSDKFVDSKDPSSLYRMAIDGLLQELGDPHTSFMTPEDYDQLRVQTQGEYGGLGIEIDVRDGWVTVISPLPGTPAERAGLQGGDRIVEVDGTSTRGWSSQDAVSRLRGPKGRAVDIRVVRVGLDEPIPFRIVRDEIHVKSVPSAYMLDDGVGYVELRVFSETSTDEVRRAVDSLRAQGARSLVLDMRRNPGGLMDQGVSVSDLFLHRGQAVLETRSRISSQNQKYSAMRGDQYPDLPLVVLVGPYSASASEIVAGALQDHDRALLIGESTFGKGSVQTLFPLAQGNFLKLTTARWYTPIGRSIQKPYGIDGDRAAPVAVGDAEPAEDALPAESFRTDAGRIVYGGGGIRPDLIVRPDTLTMDEREFARAVQRYGSKYQDAVYRFAIQQAQDNALRPGFAVTRQMLSSFAAALRDAGIEVEASVLERAERSIATSLAYEISYAKWGQQEARRRLNSDDPQVRAALEVLRDASAPASVFTLAERWSAANGAVETSGEVRTAQPAGSN